MFCKSLLNNGTAAAQWGSDESKSAAERRASSISTGRSIDGGGTKGGAGAGVDATTAAG